MHHLLTSVTLALVTVLAACSRAEAPVAAASWVAPVPLAWSTSYLLSSGNGPILVDAGTDRADDLAAVATALASEGYGFPDLQLIVVTHAHADHAGLADTLHRLSGAPVVVGRGDIPLLLAGGRTDLQPIGLEARLLKGAVPASYRIDTAGLVLLPVSRGDSLSLKPYGLDATVLSTPGHTAGSLSVVGRGAGGAPVAFVGDLLRGGSLGGKLRPHHAKTHYFHDDRAAAEAHLGPLLDRGVATFYLGHGGPLTRAEVGAFLK